MIRKKEMRAIYNDLEELEEYRKIGKLEFVKEQVQLAKKHRQSIQIGEFKSWCAEKDDKWLGGNNEYGM